MSNHTTKLVRSGAGVRGVCSCRMKQAAAVKSTQEAEDWIIWHETQVRRARAGAESVPRLPTVLKAYQASAADTNLPQRERDQWQLLADEIATRLGLNAPPSEQLGLFPPIERRP